MDPFVSIVITYYNQTQYIRSAIDSAVEQSYPKKEVIVVDDGSTVEATNYLEQVKRTSTVIHQSNAGVAAARNKGFSSSRGDFVIFLDGDDMLKPGCIASHVATLAQNPQAGLVFSAQERINESGSLLDPFYLCLPRRQYFTTFLECNPIRCPATAMYSRKAVEAVGGYDSSMQPCEDYDLSLRVVRLFPVLRHLALACSYRVHGDGVSRQSERMHLATIAVLEKARTCLALNPREQIALHWGYRRARLHFGRPSALRYITLKLGCSVRTLLQISFTGLFRDLCSGSRFHLHSRQPVEP